MRIKQVLDPLILYYFIPQDSINFRFTKRVIK